MNLMRVLDNESLLYDIIHNDGKYDLSIESIMNGLNYEFNNHESIMKFSRGFDRFNTNKNTINTNTICGKNYITKIDDDRYLITIEDELLFDFLINDQDVIGNFINKLTDIPDNNIIELIVNLGVDTMDYPIIESSTFILNLIKMNKSHKIFNFGSKVSFIDLMIATCCDEIHVGEFASLSLIKLYDRTKIPRFIMASFEQFVKYVYTYWLKKGLFTSEELIEFMATDETHKDIILLSDEIKRRLNK